MKNSHSLNLNWPFWTFLRSKCILFNYKDNNTGLLIDLSSINTLTLPLATTELPTPPVTASEPMTISAITLGSFSSLKILIVFHYFSYAGVCRLHSLTIYIPPSIPSPLSPFCPPVLSLTLRPKVFFTPCANSFTHPATCICSLTFSCLLSTSPAGPFW